MYSEFTKAKILITKLGYTKPLHQINLIDSGNGNLTVDYEPCNFLRDVIESGRTDDLVAICNAFLTFSIIENHPFTKFIESTNLVGESLNETTINNILDDYDKWFKTNLNTYIEWDMQK